MISNGHSFEGLCRQWLRQTQHISYEIAGLEYESKVNIMTKFDNS